MKEAKRTGLLVSGSGDEAGLLVPDSPHGPQFSRTGAPPPSQAIDACLSYIPLGNHLQYAIRAVTSNLIREARRFGSSFTRYFQFAIIHGVMCASHIQCPEQTPIIETSFCVRSHV